MEGQNLLCRDCSHGKRRCPQCRMIFKDPFKQGSTRNGKWLCWDCIFEMHQNDHESSSYEEEEPEDYHWLEKSRWATREHFVEPKPVPQVCSIQFEDLGEIDT